MLLPLLFLLTGHFCHSFTDVPSVAVQQNTQAILPCPHKEGDVSWSRLVNGEMVVLVTIEKGQEKINDHRYGSLADNSLVIKKVRPSDSAMYFCNRGKIYLEVTTDPNMVTQQHNGLGSGQMGGAAADDRHQTSDSWKLPAGAVVAAALVTLVIVTLRFCSKKRQETNSSVAKTEVIYEEIPAGEEQPRRESDVESPYYWTPVSEMPTTSTHPSNNLYSTVNKLRTEGRRSEECVYYLAQNPLQTGNISDL